MTDDKTAPEPLGRKIRIGVQSACGHYSEPVEVP
jgi:hypothetical protein